MVFHLRKHLKTTTYFNTVGSLAKRIEFLVKGPDIHRVPNDTKAQHHPRSAGCTHDDAKVAKPKGKMKGKVLWRIERR